MAKERIFTTYDGTDKCEPNTPDTRSEHEWFLYYLLYVDKTEYSDFTTWLADMLKSGVLEEETA